jgi:hypothetical protein
MLHARKASADKQESPAMLVQQLVPRIKSRRQRLMLQPP